MNYPISVIVPVYGVEKYIERCVVSLFEQDFTDIEYIFVNDCTLDNSISILEALTEKYLHRKTHTKIIHHKKNEGLGAARKTGVINAMGEYLIHIDSDDWCELNMLSSLYKKAKEENADVVVCDFFTSTDKKDNYIRQKYVEDSVENLKGVLNGCLHGAVWNKLIKRSLYENNNILPPSEISLLEDKWLTFRLMYFSRKLVYIPKAFMHYRQDNSVSLTKELNEKKINDLKWYVDTTEIFLKDKKIYTLYQDSFLIGNLYCILSFDKGNNFVNNIDYVCPEANRIEFLWKNHCLGFFKKIVYSLNFIGLGSVAFNLRKVFIKLK